MDSIPYLDGYFGLGGDEAFEDALFDGPVTVSELNAFLQDRIDTAPQLRSFYLTGEISNFKNHYQTGHFYFTLKDESSQIRAVMFRSNAQRVPFVPENGMKVTALGRVSVYKKEGNCQFYCESMEPTGVGSLSAAFEQLKKKLGEEGLFDPSRKKPLPKNPTRIGIVTSPTGAAIQDMINVIGRRFPLAELIIYPALVQGADAAPDLIAGIRYFNDSGDADVLIIGRGGGSMEDLWAFNDEKLARTVASSRIPVISAVGHETDFTICDFAADVRAPTPSAAAEIAVPDRNELRRKIEALVQREAGVLNRIVAGERERLRVLSSSRVFGRPETITDDMRMHLDGMSEKLAAAGERFVEDRRGAFREMTGKLEALNPMSVISRGYSAVFREGGGLVKSVHDIKPADTVMLKLADGEAKCRVEETYFEMRNGQWTLTTNR